MTEQPQVPGTLTGAEAKAFGTCLLIERHIAEVKAALQDKDGPPRRRRKLAEAGLEGIGPRVTQLRKDIAEVGK